MRHAGPLGGFSYLRGARRAIAPNKTRRSIIVGRRPANRAAGIEPQEWLIIERLGTPCQRRRTAPLPLLARLRPQCGTAAGSPAPDHSSPDNDPSIHILILESRRPRHRSLPHRERRARSNRRSDAQSRAPTERSLREGREPALPHRSAELAVNGAQTTAFRGAGFQSSNLLAWIEMFSARVNRVI